MDIDLTRLKYFVTVADELHFKRAADRLRITPPPLSKQIKLLERELGGELFERRYHDLKLTSLGAALLPEARSVLERVESLKAVARAATGQRPPLRFGLTAYAPSDFVAAFEEASRSVNAVPEILGSAADVTAQLVAGHIELGLIHLPAMDDRLITETVITYQGAVAVRTDDPLAASDTIRVEDLAGRDVLVDFARPNPQLLAWTIRELEARGVTQIVHSATTRASEIEMASHAFNRHLPVLIAYAPDSFMGRIFSPPQFKLVRIDELSWPAAEIALAWTEATARRDPRVLDAVDQLRDSVRASQPAR